jgi:hypothetical protein
MNRTIQLSFNFYKGKGPLAWLIRKITKSEFSHVEVAVRDDDEAATSEYNYWRIVCFANRRCSVEYSPSKIEPDASLNYFQIASTDQVRGFLDFAWLIAGAKYDFFGALKAGTRFGREHPDYWFCSEAAATVWNMFMRKKLFPADQTPGSLFNFLVSSQRLKL